MRLVRVSLVAVALAASNAGFPSAQEQSVAPTRILTNPGQTTQSIEGSLKGYEGRRFIFAGRPGRQMDVRLTSNNRFLYFNVLDPRGNAVFNGSASADPGRFSDRLDLAGSYAIDLYLMRNEARRASTVSFTLDVTQSENRPSGPGRGQGGGSDAGFDCRRANNPVERT